MKYSSKKISRFRHELKLKIRRVLSKMPKFIGPRRGPMYYDEVFPGKEGYLHKAIDYYAEFGSPVLASADGIVYKTEYNSPKPGGTAITIYHPTKVLTSYHHLDTILVTQKQQVKRGDIIGTVGLSGRRGPHDASPPKVPHLHFMMSIKNEYVNPEDYIVDCFDPEKKYRDQDHTYPVPCNSTLSKNLLTKFKRTT
jgi:murein DD-endopeptidase MepM/ murein hydrolase activator NlpD